jgi:hypothetical protein
MHRIALDSTTLASVLYSPDRCLLDLEFRNGAVYHYFDVPLSTYRELLKADSKGTYFNRNIRNRFRYQQVRHSQMTAPHKS